MTIIKYGNQELDRLDDTETIQNLKLCRAIHAAFMGVPVGDIQVVYKPTETAERRRAA